MGGNFELKLGNQCLGQAQKISISLLPLLAILIPGGFARQSSSSSSGIPIMRRWFSFQPPPPIRVEPSSFSNENESVTKYSGLGQGSALNSCDSTETNPNTSSGCSRNVDNLVKPALIEKSLTRV